MSVEYVVIQNLTVSGSSLLAILGFVNNSGTMESSFSCSISLSGVTSPASFQDAVNTSILNFCSGAGYTNVTSSRILWNPARLPNSPQAAIADSPADAVTNYNVVTTLLGSVTGAVNAANTKQNAIAMQLNTLLAELRTLGILST